MEECGRFFYILILIGGTTCLFVLLWFLPLAIHQDDLPAPPVRLPPNPHVPHAKVYREEVSPGAGWHPSLTGASSQAGASE